MIRPLRDRIVVSRSATAEKSVGGIIIPDAGKEKPCEGVVLAVGTGHLLGENLIPLEVQVGDKVLFGQYSGQEVEYQGEKVLVMREEDILGVL